MENTSNSSHPKVEVPGIYKDQLLTVYHLIEFRYQLIEEIKELLNTQKAPAKVDKQWLKSFEIRKMLRLSSGKLHYLRAKGIIPFKKLGNVTYYDLEKIQALMETDSFKQRLKLA